MQVRIRNSDGTLNPDFLETLIPEQGEVHEAVLRQAVSDALPNPRNQYNEVQRPNGADIDALITGAVNAGVIACTYRGPGARDYWYSRA